ncbi:MAG: YafY family transcriptional regulator [Deltaproteobacteria bacterium]|nr:YafY family transcriptional regulator [Deltaproteobacteria bacterium]
MEGTRVRGEQIVRQWRIIQILLRRGAKGVTAPELAQELKASLRSIYRDLETLQKAGFPLYSERSNQRSYWKLVEGFHPIQTVPFSMDELRALEVCRCCLRPLAGTALADPLDRTIAKVNAMLPGSTPIRSCFSTACWPSRDYRKMSGVIRSLQEAIELRAVLTFRYRSLARNETRSRIVDPHALYLFLGTLYLVAHCQLRQEIRLFTVDRIRRPRMTGKHFERPDDFDLDQVMSDAFRVHLGPPEEVVLAFRLPASDYVRERTWHRSQRVQETEDGGCMLRLEVPISWEIRAWVMAWGPDCEVLLPDELRASIHKAHRLAAKAYD